MKYLLLLLTLSACSVMDLPDPIPECENWWVEQRDTVFVIWYGPEGFPPSDQIMYVNGVFVSGGCLRSPETLQIGGEGKRFAILTDRPGIFCIDRDASVEENDMDCCIEF